MKLKQIQEARYHGGPPPIIQRIVDELLTSIDADSDYEIPFSEFPPEAVEDYFTGLYGEPRKGRMSGGVRSRTWRIPLPPEVATPKETHAELAYDVSPIHDYGTVYVTWAS